MDNNYETSNSYTKVRTTATDEKFKITAGGSDYVPFALGDYVNTSSPLLIEEPPTVVERSFTGGAIIPLLPVDNIQPPAYFDDSSLNLRQSELYFNSHFAELIAKFDGKFVAIMNNSVIDSDTDLDSMMQRVYKIYGYRPILMRRVTKQPEHKVRLPSLRSTHNR